MADTLLVIKESDLTGKMNVMKIDATPESVMEWVRSGQKIQDFFPLMPKEQREFLISGCTPEEWADLKDELEDMDVQQGEDDIPDMP